MRIALYLNNLWGISATARIAYMLAKEWIRKRIEVIFAINKPPIEIATEFPVKVLKAKGDIPRAWELGEFLLNEKIDVVLGFMRPQSVVLGLVRLLKPKLKTRLVGSVHNSDNYLTYNKVYHLPYRYLVGFLLSKLDGLIAVSKGVKNDLKEAFFIPDNLMKVIYNPIDTIWVRNLSREHISEEEEKIFQNPVLINISRFTKQKGLFHLISIFEKVNKELPKSRLLIIGDGPLKEEMENIIRKKELKNKVFLLGWKKNPFPYLKRSKLYLMTSLWEGLGMVLLESMVLEVPPIAFKTRGGHVEVLEGCCPLVEYPDEEAYAEKVVELLTDAESYLSLSKKVKERIKNFEASKIAMEYLEYFKSLI